MSWSNLLTPVERAVDELLQRLHGVCVGGGAPEKPSIGNFLVTGARGTGKTTVLHTAKALCRPGRDAGNTAENTAESTAPLPSALADMVADLRTHTHWLDIVAIEPMPAKANFLTVLLVAIRSALDECVGESKRQISLLEEEAESAWGLLDELIEDSALVWEEIRESNTREHAHRQVAAAENYLGFHDRLTTAMKKVTATIGKYRHCSHVVLILPLDDIDRSAIHLERIFKLARMVACPQLVLVLAGDRIEIETFMQHAYLVELVGDGAGRALFSAPSDLRAQDPRSIARRQASATINKVIPPSHRVEVDLVSPAEALGFRPTPGGERLRALLAKIPVGGHGTAGDQPTTLLEMFVFDGEDVQHPRHSSKVMEKLRGRLRFADGENARRESRPPHEQADVGEGSPMVETGYQALHLSARSLVDLWLLLDRERQESSALSDRADSEFAERHAHRVTRTMLRLLVAESDLPHWAADAIQEQIVMRGLGGSTRIVVSHDRRQNLVVGCLRGAVVSYRGDRARALMIAKSNEFIVRVVDRSGDSITLPAAAAGWLLILHDLLMYSPSPLVLNGPGTLLDRLGTRLVTQWQLSIDGRRHDVDLLWSRPRWETCYEQAVMDCAWLAVVSFLKAQQYKVQDFGPAQTRRMLALLWIDIIVWVGSGGRRAGCWQQVAEGGGFDMKTCTETLAAVICTLRDGHESGLFVDSPDPKQRRLWALQEWLRHELPLLLAAEFDHDLELGNIAPAGERERALLRRRLAREVVPEGAGDDEIEAVAWSLGLQVDAKPKAES